MKVNLLRTVKALSLILPLGIMNQLNAQSVVTLTTGSSWTVPAGVNKITVECIGGGGGGASSNTSGRSGGGGGGGAYASSLINVTPGTTYTIQIGAGGGAGGNGNKTIFGNNLVVADGGIGATNNSRNGGAGGQASSSVGQITFSGGNGGNGGNDGCGDGAGGGGSAGRSTQNGLNGANGTSSGGGNGGAGTGISGAGAKGVDSHNNGNSGSNYGGGGGGAKRGCASAFNRTGGSGAQGVIRITYETCTTPQTPVLNGPNALCAGNSGPLSISNTETNTDYLWYTGTCPSFKAIYDFSSSIAPTVRNTTINSLSGGTIRVTSTNNDPGINLTSLINPSDLNPSIYKYLQIKYKVVSGNPNEMEFYYSKNGGNDLSENQVVRHIPIVDGNWHVETIDMSTSVNYTTGISGLRLDYAAASGVTMEIDYIMFSNSPLLNYGTNFTANINATTTFTVVAINQCGLSSCDSKTVTFADIPNNFNIVLDTVQTPLCLNSKLPLHIPNSESGVNYQLYINGISTGSNIAGNNATINLSSNNLNNSIDSIKIIATNSYGCAQSKSLITPIAVQTTASELASNLDSKTCYINANNAFVEFRDGIKAIGAINPGNQNLGLVTMTEFVELLPIGVQACNTDSVNQPQFNTAALNRHWLINSEKQPTAPVQVRFYIAEQDVTNLMIKANNNANLNDDVLSISNLDLNKYNGPNENGSIADNCGENGSTTIHTSISNGPISGTFGGNMNIPNSYYITYTIPSFSEFWLSGTNNVSPLPIKLGNFNLHCLDGGIEVDWTSVSETNNDHFIIERSSNGLDYISVGKVDGAGNSNIPLHYTWIDTNPVRGIAYYRLKQIDYNGDNETFTAQSIYCKELVNPFRVYPNPAFDIIHIEFTSNETNLNSRIELVDISGRIIYTESIKTDQGLNTYTLNNIEFNPGIYFIRVHLNAEEILTEKIVLSK